MRFPGLIGALGTLWLAGGLAHAENLLDIYNLAVVNDPLIREADANRMATR